MRIQTQAVRSRIDVRCIALSAVLLSLIYLPTLRTGFDFVDDGCLVYPKGAGSLIQLTGLIWDTSLLDFRSRGPFRPVLWAHLVAEAELFQANAFVWRAVHLCWTMLATATLLWLLAELNIAFFASVIVAALAMWNSYRGETWINLTITEGIAMPYALTALVCAIRAARSNRSFVWDVTGAVCMLAALGCKNTFAAVVPVQCALRIVAEPQSLTVAWQMHWRRALALGLTLALPIAHFAVYKSTWHPGQYQTSRSMGTQFVEMLRCVRGAISYEFMLSGAALAVGIVFIVRSRALPDRNAIPMLADWTRETWVDYRPALCAGGLLLAGGIAVYMPIDGVAGRYSMPAVWGADILFGVLLSQLMLVRERKWQRLAIAALGAGLIGVAIANVGKQDRFRARARLLWDMLEYVESHAPPHSCLAWNCTQELTVSEAIHFHNHLQARGRRDLGIVVIGDKSNLLPEGRLGTTISAPQFALGGTSLLAADQWQPMREFNSYFWIRLREYQCRLYTRANDPAAATRNETNQHGGETVVRHRPRD